MKTFIPHIVLSLALFANVAFAQSADSVAQNVKYLEDFLAIENPSDVQLHDASEAIRHLTELGDEFAIPVLKRLLAVDKLNTAARTALVNVKTPDKTCDALLESLDTLKGKNLAGVIESLASMSKHVSPLAKWHKVIDTIFVQLKNSDETVVRATIAALAEFETENRLFTILDDKNSPYRKDAANSILVAARNREEAAKNTHATPSMRDDAIALYEKLLNYPEFPEVYETALTHLILFDLKDDSTRFVKLLTSDDVLLHWKSVLDIAANLRDPQTPRLIFDNFAKLPRVNKAELIEVIGRRADAKTVIDDLITLALSNDGGQFEIRIAAINALGRIGDMKSFEAFLMAAESNRDINEANNKLHAAGKAGLAMLQGDSFNASIIAVLDSGEKQSRLVAIEVVGERRITEATNKIKQLFNDNDSNIRIAAYRTFVQIVIAKTSDFELLWKAWLKYSPIDHNNNESDTLHSTLKTVCLKMTTPDECSTVIEKLLKTSDNEQQLFLLELLFCLGNEKAAKIIADCALSQDDKVVDKATNILGQWYYPEVAPYLLDLAKTHPAEKYRVRALRGYVRVIRQFGLPPEQKYEMITAAETVAVRDDEKKLIAETKTGIEKLLKGKPIFDGKTFSGWQFRDNQQWFRIEDGAVIGGSLKERIPRNEFVCTEKEYEDFTLRLEAKVLGEGANAGVQFRSQRLPKDNKNPNEMIGYQADMTNTSNYWGCLYDESRRNKFLAEADKGTVDSVFRKNDWNEIVVVCKGNNIKIFLNGKQTVDYTETDETIPKRGVIGLQIHAAPPSEAMYRNIRIEE